MSVGDTLNTLKAGLTAPSEQAWTGAASIMFFFQRWRLLLLDVEGPRRDGFLYLRHCVNGLAKSMPGILITLSLNHPPRCHGRLLIIFQKGNNPPRWGKPRLLRIRRGRVWTGVNGIFFHFRHQKCHMLFSLVWETRHWPCTRLFSCSYHPRLSWLVWWFPVWSLVRVFV